MKGQVRRNRDLDSPVDQLTHSVSTLSCPLVANQEKKNMEGSFWVHFQKRPFLPVVYWQAVLGVSRLPPVGPAAAPIPAPDLQKTDGTGGRLRQTSIKLVFW